MEPTVLAAIITGVATVAAALITVLAVRRRRSQPSAGQRPIPPPPADGDIIYTVRHGDTLLKIARSHCTTVEVLVRANGISDPDYIEPGEQLRIPQGG